MALQHLLIDKTGPQLGLPIAIPSSRASGRRSIQVGVTGNGAVSCVVRIWAMNDARFPVEVMTFTLSGTDKASTADEDDFPWETYQAQIVSSSQAALVSVAVSS